MIVWVHHNTDGLYDNDGDTDLLEHTFVDTAARTREDCIRRIEDERNGWGVDEDHGWWPRPFNMERAL